MAHGAVPGLQLRQAVQVPLGEVPAALIIQLLCVEHCMVQHADYEAGLVKLWS